MDTAKRHQLAIARKTMGMSCVGARIMGGMDHVKAGEMLGKRRPAGCVCGVDAERAKHCTHPEQEWCDCDWCRVVRAHELEEAVNERNTVTCWDCHQEFPDEEMVPREDGEGELCQVCAINAEDRAEIERANEAVAARMAGVDYSKPEPKSGFISDEAWSQ